MRHLFIVNPVAGKLKPEEKKSRVTDAVAALPSELRRDAQFEVYVTTAPMDACGKIKEEALLYDDLRVYACGGDGTLNECVNGAAGLPNVSVTHYPCGTGNDFIKTFGEEKSRFFELRELVGGEMRPMDLIDCNGRMGLSICSVGVDARVGGDVHKYSDIPLIGGATGYVVSAAANFIKGIKSEMTVTTEGLTCGPELNMVCVCNGRYYGGGFNPVPEARPDDGVLDCLIVSGVNRFNFLGAITTYAKGKYKSMPKYITYVATDRVEIDARNEEVVNIDGEIIRGRHIVMSLVPRGVNFIFPKDMKFFRER